MADTETKRDLFQTCLWDLAEGCRALTQRLPAVARCAEDGALREALDSELADAAERAKRLAALMSKSDGPANLWMAGILDDAERDTRTVAPGPLLDVAMIGAVRKALHAEIASLHTARAMADVCAEHSAAEAVDRNLAAVEDRDAALHALLGRIAHSLDSQAAAPAA